MIISHSTIEQKAKCSIKVTALSIFALVGLAIPLIPFATIKEINFNSLISFFVLLCIFGIPFGIFIGAKNIIDVLSVRKKLLNGEYSIEIDTISELSTVNTTFDNNDSSFCQATLKNYSDRTNKNITVTYSDYRKLKEGDRCILIFVKSKKKPVLIFPGNSYEIGDDIKNKIKFAGEL